MGARHATDGNLQADPLTGAILTLAQIRAMMGELFEANREYMADWPAQP